MRVIIMFLLAVCSFGGVFAQPIVLRSSSANTVSDSRLQAGLNFLLPRYADTVAANTFPALGIDSTGAVIYTYTPNGLWVRKANPKRWVQIVDVASGSYAAGYGLVLGGTTFRVDTALVTTLGRLYKVRDSMKAYNAATYQPVGSYATTTQLNTKVNISDTAAMLSPYLRSAAAATTYASLSALSDSAAAIRASAGGGVPTLDQVAHQGSTSSVDIGVAEGAGLFAMNGGFYAVIYADALTTDRSFYLPDEGGELATREWVQDQGYSTGGTDSATFATRHYADSSAAALAVINLTTTGTSGAATWNSGTRTLNVPQYTGTIYTAGSGITIAGSTISGDSTVLATRRYTVKVGDSTFARVIAQGYISTIDSTTYATRSYAKKVGDSTFARVIAQGFISAIDSTTYGTRAYVKKVGDSTYARVIDLGYVTQSGARTALSLTTTGTSGASTYNSATGVFNIPQYSGTTYSAGNGLALSGTTFLADTTVLATRNYGKKIGDSTLARVVALGYLTSASAATTYVPQTRTITAGTGLSGGGDLSANRTVNADTTTLATIAQVQRKVDSTSALMVHLAGTETISGTKTFSASPTINTGGTTSRVNFASTSYYVGMSASTTLNLISADNLNVQANGGGTLSIKGAAGTTIETSSGNTIIQNSSTQLVRVSSAGATRFGTGGASAIVHIKAGTTAANTAPLKLDAGTNMTTPEAGAVEYDGSQIYETNSTAVRGNIQVTRTNVSSAVTQTLVSTYSDYIFNGVASVWTLPALSGNTNLVLYLKNRGSGTLTVNSSAGGNDLYLTAATSTISLAPGESVRLVWDGTFINVE